ncbi:MAG: hypothetical protein KatS3mg084_0320 [Candidatus Dojkabacteria bacterium]|nr:MAG: hypothetical protein KatS3mg084_0320 [Candidatus Dojkabacteria bacterium]
MKQNPQTTGQIEQILRKYYPISFDTVCNYLSQKSQKYPQDSIVSVAEIKKLNLDLFNNLHRDSNNTYLYNYLKSDEDIHALDRELHLPLPYFEVRYPGVLVASSYTYSACILELLFTHTDLKLDTMLQLRTLENPIEARKEIRQIIGAKLFKRLYRLDLQSREQCKQALLDVQNHFGVRL